MREMLLLTHFIDEGSDDGGREVTWQQALALRFAARLCGLCCQAGGVTIHGQRTPALNMLTCVLTRGNVTCHEELRRQEWHGASERQVGGEGGPEGGPPRARVPVAGQAGYDCLHPPDSWFMCLPSSGQAGSRPSMSGPAGGQFAGALS